jgi:hypothetical protein
MKQNFVVLKKKNEKRRNKIELVVLINEILKIVFLACIENKSKSQSYQFRHEIISLSLTN